MGLVALWCYGVLTIDEHLDPLIHHFEHERVGPYCPPERRHVDADCGTLPFPYPRIEPPAFAMEAR